MINTKDIKNKKKTTQIQMVNNYLTKNVIVIWALVCPCHIPGQYTVQTQIVLGSVYQEKKSTSNVLL